MEPYGNCRARIYASRGFRFFLHFRYAIMPRGHPLFVLLHTRLKAVQLRTGQRLPPFMHCQLPSTTLVMRASAHVFDRLMPSHSCL